MDGSASATSQIVKTGPCSWCSGLVRKQGTISYPIRDTFLSEFVFHFVFHCILMCIFTVFTRISRFAEYTPRIQQNTLYSQEYNRIHIEYTQNTQSAKTPKSAVRAIHVITGQQRAKYRRRIRILQNTHFLIVFRAYSVRVLAYSVAYSPTCSCLPGTLSWLLFRFDNLLLRPARFGSRFCLQLWSSCFLGSFGSFGSSLLGNLGCLLVCC